MTIEQLIGVLLIVAPFLLLLFISISQGKRSKTKRRSRNIFDRMDGFSYFDAIGVIVIVISVLFLLAAFISQLAWRLKVKKPVTVIVKFQNKTIQVPFDQPTKVRTAEGKELMILVTREKPP